MRRRRAASGLNLRQPAAALAAPAAPALLGVRLAASSCALRLFWRDSSGI